MENKTVSVTEIRRQGNRVAEQLKCLQTILTDSKTIIKNISNKLSPQSKELGEELSKLIDDIESYETKSAKIYTNLSEDLISYADNLLYNLTNLRESISSITKAIENLDI